ncbi:cell division protein FtsA [Alphaproteobacteria bacterium]|nr:cell division protein FtsA [Alphaproteobacteria bacterium]
MIKVGLDIGNSKISCVVCDLKELNKPKILSFVSLPTSDVNKGSFTNYESIKKEVLEVVNTAAKESVIEIKSINLNVPLINSNSLFYNSEIEIENELISELHLKKVINQSEFFEESSNHQILMNYIINYDLDNKTFSGSPLGNYAKKLNLNFYKLLVDKNIVNTYLNLFKELDIHIENFIPTPLSSALSTLNKDDKDLGSICIDLGESSTSLAVFENSKLIFCDSVNVGSKNITNDIARGISITKESAERLKTLYGSVISSPSDEYEIIEVPLYSSDEKQFKQINRNTINSIIKPRVEETLELVWQKLKQYDLHKKRIKNLILTGGGSQLEGIADYAQIIFDSNVRLEKPFFIKGAKKEFSGPQFAQTLGSVFFDNQRYEVNFLKKSQNLRKNSIFQRFSSWLDQYI